jgi:hypothetical protein
LIDSQLYCKTNGQFARHLKHHALEYKEYFEIYETGVTPLCYCSKPLTFYQKTETYANSCGNPTCVGKSVSLTKQQWTDSEKKKDSENKRSAAAQRTSEQKRQQLQKARKTFKEKHGVEWGSKLDSQKEKSRRTKLEIYGNERYNNSDAISITNIIISISEKALINEKRRRTNREKYGIENVLMRADVRSKSARSNSIGKEYTLPSGNIIFVRGYENYVLDSLFADRYLEDQIITDDHFKFRKSAIPTFSYVDVARHLMKYFPDIYIPHENRIIEVKSEWWWDGAGSKKYASRLENNLRKQKAVVEADYNYEVWIYKSKTSYRILKDDRDFQTEYEKLQSFNS